MASVRRRRFAGMRAAALAWALLAVLASPAAGSDWSSFNLPGGEAVGPFFGVSCPATSLCVATGSNNAVATSTDPAGGAADWSLVHLPNLQEGPAGGAAQPSYFSPAAQIRGVSCPERGLCVAASRQGYVYASANPAGGTGAWKAASIDGNGPNTHLYGISCPTASFCAAVSLEGRIATSTDPTGGAGAWSVAQLPQPLELQGISCPSPALCVAVGKNGAMVASTNPTGGAGTWAPAGAAGAAGAGTLYGIACPTAGLCVTGDDASVYSTTDPTGGPASWQRAPDATPLRLMAFSCVSALACAAVDDNADVIASTNPTGGAGDWAFTSAVPFTAANGTFGISCPSLQLCVGVGNDYLVIASTDPFGDGPSAEGKKGQLRRPTVRITHHPRRVVRTRKRRVRVSFRIREIGVSDAGFLCKLDRRKFRPCRSPKSYRVGRGRHAFRVKINQPGGFDQTATVFRFRVARLHRHRRR
jgi:hypothetical protein